MLKKQVVQAGQAYEAPQRIGEPFQVKRRPSALHGVSHFQEEGQTGRVDTLDRRNIHPNPIGASLEDVPENFSAQFGHSVAIQSPLERNPNPPVVSPLNFQRHGSSPAILAAPSKQFRRVGAPCAPHRARLSLTHFARCEYIDLPFRKTQPIKPIPSGMSRWLKEPPWKKTQPCPMS